MIKHEDFDRRYSVRTIEKLSSPKTHSLRTLELPVGPIIHHMPTDSTDHGIEPRDPLLVNMDSDETLVNHVEKLVTLEGAPKEHHSGFDKAVRDYHRRYRKLRRLRRMKTAVRDNRIAIVQNYAMLQHSYTYRRSGLSTYHSWFNMRNTLWASISELMTQTDRDHFIALAIPTVLPSLADFKTASRSISKTVMETFSSDISLDLLELYLWLTDAPSLETGLTKLDPKAFSKLHLIVTESGQWSYIPMSRLVEWKEEKGGESVARSLHRYFEAILELRTVNNPTEESKHEEEVEPPPTTNPDSSVRGKEIMRQATKLAEAGMLSGAEYKRMERLSGKYKDISSPTGEGTLEDLLNIDLETINTLHEQELRDTPAVIDKTMLKTTVTEFDSIYVDKILESDIANTTMSLQNAGFAVTDYKKENVLDAVNDYDVYTVKVTPVNGSPSTIRFRVPKIQEDGTFMSNGVKARLSKQRRDLPIRKTAPDRVALTSYYGKNFIDRNSKVVFNLDKWISKHIGLLTQQDNSPVTHINYSNVLVNDVKLPRIYTAISKEVSEITVNGLALNFDHSERTKVFGEEAVKKYETKGTVVCGKGKGGYITVDMTNTFYLNKNGDVTDIGSISELMGITATPPVEAATITVFGKTLPVAMFLTHVIGIEPLLKKLKTTYRIVPKGTRTELAAHEFAVQFKDETLVVDSSDPVATLILNGFNDFKKHVKQFNFADFNGQDATYGVLTRNQLGIRYTREIELMNDMFIDHITLELLEKMKEPTVMVDLIIRGVELLTRDQHPDETDMEFMRIAGYERISGMIYLQLVDSIRKYRQKPNGLGKLEMNPKAVWMDVVRDQAVMLVEESNPIHNLKEKEMVTYSGQGGRSGRSMVRRSRVFHKKDLGTISEATIDSGKVAINTYTTANPNFDSLRGTTRRFDMEKDGAASAVSTSAVLSAMSDKDDKVIVF